MEPAAALRQLVGQIQELSDFYGSSHALYRRWCLLAIAHSSVKVESCDLITSEKSEILTMVDTDNSPPAKKCCRKSTIDKLLTNSSSKETMEQIWKELPEDLIEAVAARLPVDACIRFRTVCKKWDYLLTSSSFLQQYSETKPSHPWFFTITLENINKGAMFDPSSEKWHHPSISFLPSKMVFPVASAGGLVCFLDIGDRNFYTCNPITNSFKQLPLRSARVWSRIAVGMMPNGSNPKDGYKILCLGCDDDYHEIYDSVVGTWTRPGSLPSDIRLPLNLYHKSQAVTIGSKLYFMRGDPDGILSYDVIADVWEQYTVPSPMHTTIDHTLAECGGKLLYVGLISKNAATCVCVWELQKMTLLWKEVDRMPNVWCLEFYGKHVRMTCLGNQGLLMLSLRSTKINQLVTYDVMKKKWKKVPDCIVTHVGRKQWIACGTTFYPCPTALP